MIKLRCLFIMLLLNNVQAMNLTPLDSPLSFVADKLTKTKVIEFVSARATPDTVLESVVNVFKTEDASAYSTLAYFISTNMMRYYTGHHIFENGSDKHIAQFILAGTIIRMFNSEGHKKLVWQAFISLSLAIDGGESTIMDFGVDTEKVKFGIQEIEALYPDIYEWNLI